MRIISDLGQCRWLDTKRKAEPPAETRVNRHVCISVASETLDSDKSQEAISAHKPQLDFANHSIKSSAGRGRLRYIPCAASHPRARSRANVDSWSTPSATT